MPKVFPPEQRQMVYELSLQGRKHTEIGQMMCERFPQEWTSPKYADRAVARIIAEFTPDAAVKTLDEMTREERTKYIEGRLQATARFRMIFKNFNSEDKDVFIDEYISVIRSTESLTEVEEQALFASILELILAFQALNRKEQEEKYRDMSLRGEIPETDPRFRRVVDDKYQREYDQHMKLYQKGMEQLKMSRKDRLTEVRSQKVSLVDLAEELSHKNVQSEVAEEISRLAKLKDEELKRLIENGYLHGMFEDV